MGNWEILSQPLAGLWVFALYAVILGWFLGFIFRSYGTMDKSILAGCSALLPLAFFIAALTQTEWKEALTESGFIFLMMWQFIASLRKQNIYFWDLYRPSFYRSENWKK